MIIKKIGSTHNLLEVIPNQYKHKNLQSLLKALGASEDTNFEDDEWRFPKSKIISSLNFNIIKDMDKDKDISMDIEPFSVTGTRSFENGTIFNVTFLTIIKLLYLTEASLLASDSSRINLFRSLILTCDYLKNNNISTINLSEPKSLEEYLNHQMFHRLDRIKNVITRSSTPIHYGSIQLGWISRRIGYQATLDEIRFSEFIWGNSTVGNRNIDKAIGNILTISSDDEISINDYKRGASFNYLTLDYGRYYVDHCATYFRDTYVKSIALKKTSSEFGSFSIQAGYSKNQENLTIEANILNGETQNKRTTKTIPKSSDKAAYAAYKKGIKKRNSVSKNIISCYENHYRFHYAEVEITSAESISRMATELKLINNVQSNSEREHITDRLKVIVQSTTTPETLKHTRALLESSDFDLPYKGFTYSLLSLKKILKDECIVSYFSKQDIHDEIDRKSNTFKHLRFIYSTISAGFVYIMALLGWRQSEFGFPLNSINISINDDKLDQYFHPCRYKVFWTAKKVAKETILEREITQDTYHLIYKISLLTGNSENSACLLSKIVRPLVTDGESRAKTVNNQTRLLWLHFVKEYKPFKLDDAREEYEKTTKSISSGKVLSKQEHTRYQNLVNDSHLHSENIVCDVNLREVKIRLREEIDRVMLSVKLDYELLREYVSGNLPENESELIRTYVPQDTLDGVNATSLPNRDLTNTVNNILKDNCIYPTPHAFRHMWAECVYRRFDGDAGWMIRSHFKHISQSMWLAYIRNKDNQIIHKMAKKQVISALLNNFVKRGGEGYSGKIIQLINKSLQKTQMLRNDGSIDSDIIDDFASTQIIDIKTSPWGYCLLYRLDQDKTNCAIDGSPQRFNASPSICFGCNNFFTQATNTEGILISIAGDIKALYAPIPYILKEASRITVSNAYTHLKKIGASEIILNQILEALNTSLHKGKTPC
jgi:hypothetical protein